LIAKYRRRFPGFDEKIVSMYGRGMSGREIQGHPQEIHGIGVSPDLIGTITDAVLPFGKLRRGWRMAEPAAGAGPCHRLFRLSARLRSATRARFATRRFILPLAFGRTGPRRPSAPHGEPVEPWIEQTEGAKFWLRVMNELKNRGANDIPIAVVDGLKGFPDAINAVFPLAQVRTCIVHLIRHSIGFASWKERKSVAAALKEVYRAKDAGTARQKLEDFDAGPWGQKYPAIAGPGVKSFHSSPFRKPRGGSFTQQTQSRASTQNHGER
jgi:putative transposase